MPNTIGQCKEEIKRLEAVAALFFKSAEDHGMKLNVEHAFQTAYGIDLVVGPDNDFYAIYFRIGRELRRARRELEAQIRGLISQAGS